MSSLIDLINENKSKINSFRYHIKLIKSNDEGVCRVDLTKEELINRFINPYNNGELIVVKGEKVDLGEFKRIKITFSEDSIIRQLMATKEHEKRNNLKYSMPTEWRVIDFYSDVTDDFILKPYGNLKVRNYKEIDSSEKKDSTKPQKVFIVHGHDNHAKIEVARFIEKLDFTAIILHEQASIGNTIIEKIEAYSDVGFGIVLYTPCDKGRKNDEISELHNRARQNVVFEHGYLIGKIGRSKVCALVKGEVEKPNDISGVVYISMDDKKAWQVEVANEMKASGYDADLNKLNS